MSRKAFLRSSNRWTKTILSVFHWSKQEYEMGGQPMHPSESAHGDHYRLQKRFEIHNTKRMCLWLGRTKSIFAWPSPSTALFCVAGIISGVTVALVIAEHNHPCHDKATWDPLSVGEWGKEKMVNRRWHLSIKQLEAGQIRRISCSLWAGFHFSGKYT